ncbi:MAG: hypothetical protein F9K40_12635 [Kofleriaceae bacterium]|nr:MAG: hypothetical protein F9K40_12635 [Kofleriaceae bacterium]
MAGFRRPRAIVPALASAALLLWSGCVSAFTDGATDWTPADGKPTCRPEVGMTIDAVVALAALYAATRQPLLGACYGGAEACLVGLGLPYAVAGAGIIGAGGGVYKSTKCSDARARWQDVVAEQRHDEIARSTDRALADLADEVNGVIDVYGDTLILRAPRADVCASWEWRERLLVHRAALTARGLTRLACRVHGAEVWSGPLDRPVRESRVTGSVLD